MDTATCDRMWRSVRASRNGFSADEIARTARAELAVVADYLTWLRLEGYVAPFGPNAFRATAQAREIRTTPYPPLVHPGDHLCLHIFHQDSKITASSEYPVGGLARLRSMLFRGGQAKQYKKDTARDRMWTAIRARVRFTRLDLIQDAKVTESSVSDYIRLLIVHNLLAVVGEVEGARKQYELIDDRGVERPRLREKRRRSDGTVCQQREEA